MNKSTIKLRRDQFHHRAKAIFYARLAFDTFGILFLLVPSWSQSIAPFLPKAFFIYLAILSGHLLSYLWIGKKGDKIIYFISLSVDILALGTLIILTGGLASPLMSGLIIYTVVFAILYPHPLAIMPPLLLLPAMAKINQLIGTEVPERDLLLLLWYSGLDLIIVYVVVYFDFKENSRYFKEKKLQDEKQHLLIINERQRMAREMHDGLGATLSTIKIQAEFLKEISKGVNEIEGEADELHERTALALIELRRTVRILREDFELENSLDELLQSMESIWKYRIVFNSNLHNIDIGKKEQLNIYRAIQETLTNAGKHAQASQILVSLDIVKKPKWVLSSNIIEKESGIKLTIEDNGIGFSLKKQPEGHYGLINLRERAEELGGFCTIKSQKGKGTTVKLWFPTST